jgi:predicted phosphodiesterase
MKLHVLSDIHLETRRPSWKPFVGQIPRDLGEVLVLAGDILCIADADADEMLAKLREKAAEVLFVLGNHEHYHGAFEQTRARAAALCAAAGIKLLDGTAVVVGGRRFLGASLWFGRDPQIPAHKAMMTDFELIADLEDAVYRQNERDRAFFDEQLLAGDVAISHHLPVWSSVPPRFREGPGAALNCFFVSDCEATIHRRRPAVWIHGHTHSPTNHLVGETRIVCNPIGYPRERGGGRLDFALDV